MAKTKHKKTNSTPTPPKSKMVGKKVLMRMNRVSMEQEQEDTMDISFHKHDVCIRMSIPITQVGELFSNGMVEATIKRWQIKGKE